MTPQDLNEETDGAVAQERLVRHLLDALKRIAECEDAPDIDATGEWQTGLHCGVEDRDCRDRYEGADYGHTVGVEKALEWASNEAKHALDSLPNKNRWDTHHSKPPRSIFTLLASNLSAARSIPKRPEISPNSPKQHDLRP